MLLQLLGTENNGARGRLDVRATVCICSGVSNGANDVNLPLPVLGWLRHYDRNWLRSDVVAGITLAAYLLPAGLGDASLANLPPQAGLDACLFGGLVF